MKVLQLFTDGLRALINNIGRIFEPNDDHYPATGIIPYTDEDSDR
jgi:hypothetical protein